MAESEVDTEKKKSPSTDCSNRRANFFGITTFVRIGSELYEVQVPYLLKIVSNLCE